MQSLRRWFRRWTRRVRRYWSTILRDAAVRTLESGGDTPKTLLFGVLIWSVGFARELWRSREPGEPLKLLEAAVDGLVPVLIALGLAFIYQLVVTPARVHAVQTLDLRRERRRLRAAEQVARVRIDERSIAEQLPALIFQGMELLKAITVDSDVTSDADLQVHEDALDAWEERVCHLYRDHGAGYRTFSILVPTPEIRPSVVMSHGPRLTDAKSSLYHKITDNLAALRAEIRRLNVAVPYRETDSEQGP